MSFSAQSEKHQEAKAKTKKALTRVRRVLNQGLILCLLVQCQKLKNEWKVASKGISGIWRAFLKIELYYFKEKSISGSQSPILCKRKIVQ